MTGVPTPVPTPVTCPDPFSCGARSLQQAADAVGGAVSGAVQTVDFWTDPWGNTFKSLQAAAHDLAESVLPTVVKATLPDLSAKWFLSAYAVAFGLAIFVAVVLLLPQLVRTARGLQSGRELAESVGIYFPLFLVGAMFGPPFGVLLVNFFQSISDSIVRWGITGTTGTITEKFQAMLTADDAGGIAGGAPVGVLLMLLMLTGLLLVVIMLIVQQVTLYFTGVLLPLGLVWIIDPTRRRFGSKIATIWLGILASHPLLFFLLAIAYLMVANSVDAFGRNSSLGGMVQLIVSVLALFLAGLSPFVLMKLAPVLPTGGAATSGPALTGMQIGAQNLTEADNRYGTVPPGGNASETNGSSQFQSSTASDESGDSSPAPSLAGAGSAAGGATGAAGPQVTAQKPGDPTGTASGAAAQPATAAGEPETGERATMPRPAVLPSGGAAAPPAGAAAAAGGTEAGAAGATVAVGAEETATGAGAAIGIPTMLVGSAIAGAEFVQRTTETVGDHATAAMDDREAGRESSSG